MNLKNTHIDNLSYDEGQAILKYLKTQDGYEREWNIEWYRDRDPIYINEQGEIYTDSWECIKDKGPIKQLDKNTVLAHISGGLNLSSMGSGSIKVNLIPVKKLIK